jgi:hypothetical protein
MTCRLVAFAVLAGLVGCEPLAPEQARIQVRTDRPEYVLDPEDGLASIQLTVTNQSKDPVYLTGCPGVPSFVAEREEGGAWRELFQVNVICLAIHTPLSITLSSSQAHTSSLSWGSSGTFRLRVLYGAARDEAWGRASTSPPFVVR